MLWKSDHNMPPLIQCSHLIHWQFSVYFTRQQQYVFIHECVIDLLHGEPSSNGNHVSHHGNYKVDVDEHFFWDKEYLGFAPGEKKYCTGIYYSNHGAAWQLPDNTWQQNQNHGLQILCNVRLQLVLFIYVDAFYNFVLFKYVLLCISGNVFK